MTSCASSAVRVAKYRSAHRSTRDNPRKECFHFLSSWRSETHERRGTHRASRVFDERSPVREHAAAQKPTQLVLDEPRHPEAMLALVTHAREEGLEVFRIA